MTRCIAWCVGTMAVALAVTGCDDGPDDDRIVGNGVEATEDRTYDAFERVEVSDAITADIVVDGGATGSVVVTVTADENLLEHIDTHLSGDTLVVDTEGDIETDLQLTVSATVPSLTGGEASDAAALLAEGIDADDFDIRCANAGIAVVDGQAVSVDAEADNAGEVDAEALVVETATVDADNGSRITVCASSLVQGQAHNGSSVDIYCGAGDVSVDTDESSGVTEH